MSVGSDAYKVRSQTSSIEFGRQTIFDYSHYSSAVAMSIFAAVASLGVDSLNGPEGLRPSQRGHGSHDDT